MKISGAINNKQFLQMVNQQPQKGADKPRSKFNATPVKAGFDSYDSKHESRKAADLLMLQQTGFIENLQLDKRALRFPLDVNGIRICEYEADGIFDCVKDFELSGLNGVYRLSKGQHVVYDAKSPPTRKTRGYVIKRNLMFAIHGVKILEG